ncbi:MAG: hypothetical protein WCF12_05205 [Propionicimonas sp.]
MSGFGRVLGVSALALATAAGLAGCGSDTSGTSSLTVELTDLVGAEGTQLRAELRKTAGYFEEAPVWEFLTTTVSDSPFAQTGTVEELPDGEFTLVVLAGSDEKSKVAEVKGQGCEMTLALGKGEHATIAIDGLNEFGEKGYGECRATRK